MSAGLHNVTDEQRDLLLNLNQNYRHQFLDPLKLSVLRANREIFNYIKIDLFSDGMGSFL